MMSDFADSVYKLLKEIFPYYTIVKEYYINYEYTRLFFDFYIKELNSFIEVQGQQHYKYIEYFHGSMEGFIAYKKRDNLKKEYCEKHNIVLVEVTKTINKEQLIDLFFTNGR